VSDPFVVIMNNKISLNQLPIIYRLQLYALKSLMGKMSLSFINNDLLYRGAL